MARVRGVSTQSGGPGQELDLGLSSTGGALTFVYGPPGFGAEQVVRQWADSRAPRRRLMWFDAAQGQKLAAVIRDLTSKVERMGAEQSHLESPGSYPAMVVVAGVQATPGLDEYLAADPDGVFAVFDLIVISDRRPETSLVGRLSRLVGPEDMLLKTDECRAVLTAAAPDASPETIDRVVSVSGRWPALVEAATASLGADAGDVDTAIVHIRAVIVTHLVAWLPAHWRPVLRHLMSVGRATLRELDELQSTDTSAVLSQMRDMCLLQTEPTEDRSYLRLFPTLQQALHAQARVSGSDELMAMHREAAVLRFRLGILDCGLRSASLARDWRLCSAIIDRWWPQIVFRGHRALGQRVVTILPVDAINAFPGTGYYAEQLGILPVGTTKADLPDRADRVPGIDDTVVVLRRTIVAMLARRTRGRLVEAKEIAEELLPTVERSVRAVHSKAAGIVSLWHLHAGLSCQMAGDSEQARRFFHHAWRMREYDEFGFVARDVAAKLAVNAAMAGDAGQSKRWIGEAAQQQRGVDFVEDFIERGLQLAEFIIATDSLALASASIVPGRINDMYARDEFWPFVLWARARHDLTHGRARDVLRMVDDAESLFSFTSGADGVARHICAVLRADAYMVLGQGAAAQRVLAAVGEGQQFDRAVPARLRLLSGDAAGAVEMADENKLARATSDREQLELLLIEVAARWRLGDAELAAERLIESVNLSDRTGHVRVFATVPRDILSELSAAVPAVAPLVAMLDEKSIAPIYPERLTLNTLTERELVVIRGLATGATIGTLAEQMFVSRNTLKSQLRSLYAKLDVHARNEAVAVAGAMGLLESP